MASVGYNIYCMLHLIIKQVAKSEDCLMLMSVLMIILGKNYTPINIMPHYPSQLCRVKGGAFDFDLTPKPSPYVGNLTAHHTHVQK